MITAYDVLRAMLFCKVLSEHPHFTVPAGYFSIIHISEQIMPLHSFVAFSLLFISQTTLLRFLYLLFDLYLFVSSEATSRIAKKRGKKKTAQPSTAGFCFPPFHIILPSPSSIPFRCQKTLLILLQPFPRWNGTLLRMVALMEELLVYTACAAISNCKEEIRRIGRTYLPAILPLWTTKVRESVLTALPMDPSG